MTPPIPMIPLISILPAAFGEVDAEAALTAEPVAEGEVDRVEEVILAGPLADEEAEAEADPLDMDMEELEDMVILDILELEEMDMLEFDDMELAEALAEALAIAARLADPPPIVEKGVHWEVAPAGWGAGVVGSPWEKVEPE
jgi:hypothetical protein